MAERTEGESASGDGAESARPGQDAAHPEIARLAAEVLRYLRRHPGAADTVEGIAEWWIAKQRLEDTPGRVQAAVDRLVAQGLVESTGGAAGRLRYRLRDAPSGEAAAAADRHQTGAGD
ncbi:MAG: MarR family transcriptional regulator [Chromatiaceae bacterium]|jgi:DNA-binding MarR family transcriptional regulator|nr:MarR family transcriptional regulator [Chromatiaceae bacterium]